MSSSAGLKRWFDSSDTGREGNITYHEGIARREMQADVLPRKTLVARLNSTMRRMRYGGMHGDLNCGNVLIREQSPLLIDFSYCNDGPLLADPAWLEVNLVFGWDWYANGDEDAATATKKEVWHQIVGQLYQPRVLQEPFPLNFGENLDNETHRLCSAVGIIRRHAFAVSLGEEDYSLLIAAALIRFSSRRDSGRNAQEVAAAERRSERAARAYQVASDIVKSLKGLVA